MILALRLKQTYKRLFIAIYVAFLAFDGYSQVDSLPACVFSSNKFDVDLLDNYYSLCEDNQTLYKFKNGQIICSFKSPNGISIDDFGVNSFHKIFIFSKSNQIVFILDNELGLLESIPLDELGFWNISSVDYSKNDNLWMLDTDNRQIIETNVNNNQARTNYRIREIFDNLGDYEMKVKDENIFIYNDKNLFVYSKVGEYLYHEEITHPMILSKKGFLFYCKNGHLYKQQRKMPEDVKYLLEGECLDEKPSILVNNKLFQMMGNTIKILPIKL